MGAAGGLLVLKWWGLIGLGTPVTAPGNKRVYDVVRGMEALGLWPTAMTDLGTVTDSVSGKLSLSAGKVLALDTVAGWIFMGALVVLAVVAWRHWKEVLGGRGDALALDRRASLVAVCIVGASSVLYAGIVSVLPYFNIESRLERSPVVWRCRWPFAWFHTPGRRIAGVGDG